MSRAAAVPTLVAMRDSASASLPAMKLISLPFTLPSASAVALRASSHWADSRPCKRQHSPHSEPQTICGMDS